jgi:hypothetical protein
MTHIRSKAETGLPSITRWRQRPAHREHGGGDIGRADPGFFPLFEDTLSRIMSSTFGSLLRAGRLHALVLRTLRGGAKADN